MQDKYWQRPDCPAMQVEHLDHPGPLLRVLLAEAQAISRALSAAREVAGAERLRQQLCNRLNLLGLMVSEGRVRPARWRGA